MCTPAQGRILTFSVRGVGNFSPLTLLTRRGTSLASTSSNRRLSDILKIHFFSLFKNIFCKGTNKITMAV